MTAVSPRVFFHEVFTSAVKEWNGILSDTPYDARIDNLNADIRLAASGTTNAKARKGSEDSLQVFCEKGRGCHMSLHPGHYFDRDRWHICCKGVSDAASPHSIYSPDKVENYYVKMIGDTVKTDDPIKPSHYYSGTYEVVNVINAWGLSFELGNTVKYVARAGKKDPDKTIEDLNKAKRYIELEIERLTNEGN